MASGRAPELRRGSSAMRCGEAAEAAEEAEGDGKRPCPGAPSMQLRDALPRKRPRRSRATASGLAWELRRGSSAHVLLHVRQPMEAEGCISKLQHCSAVDSAAPSTADGAAQR